jgi:hypothetical protein
MATFEEMRQYAREKYQVSGEDETGFSLLFEYENGRSQLIGCFCFEALEREFIEFRTRVCAVQELGPHQALKLNAGFTLGALALEDGYYYLIANLMVKDMDPDEFDLPVNILAAIADELEGTYSNESDQF